MQLKLAKWSSEDPNQRFERLLRLIAQPEWLNLALHAISTNSGFHTPGIDGVSGKTFLENQELHINAIRNDLLAGTYKPSPVKRVYIPKVNGTTRPLGIPTIRDRVVQQAMKMAMEPIWESVFCSCSYGFRPGRSTHHAIRHVVSAASCWSKQAGSWIIEGDLSNYFGTVHHKKLMKFIKRRIKDKRFLNLIWSFLKAGVMEKNLFIKTEEGVPQGGIISPLLANIFLHEFDRFMTDLQNDLYLKRDEQVKIGNQSPVCAYVRYADDFVVVVFGTKNQTIAIRNQIKSILEIDLNLTLNMDKTNITHINDGFMFLGYQIARKRTASGKMNIVTSIPKIKLDNFCAKLRQVLSKDFSMDSFDMLMSLTAKIRGWLNYFKFTTFSHYAKSRISRLSFWKYAYWLARKHKSKISLLIKQQKFYSTPNGKKYVTWVRHKQEFINGTMVNRFAYLISPWDIKNSLFKATTPKGNYFLFVKANAKGIWNDCLSDWRIAFSG